MSITINSDEDLRNISNMLRERDPYHYEIKDLYILPGYRCLTCLGEHDDNLYIRFKDFMKFRNIKQFQLKWIYPVDRFVDIAKEFGFYRPYDTYPGICIYRPSNFSIEDENRLITELLNINDIKNRYGLK